jgi:WD40 repeat protein
MYGQRDGWFVSVKPVVYTKLLGKPERPDGTQRLPTLAAHLAWDQQGQSLIVHQDSGAILMLDPDTGSTTTIAQTGSVFAYCPEKHRLVVNLGGGAVLLSLSDGGFDRITAGSHDHAAFSTDCSTLALANEAEKKVEVWRPTGQWQTVKTTRRVRNSLTLSADGRYLAAAGGTFTSEDGHRTLVELFELSRTSDPRWIAEHANPDVVLGMWAMAFSADGSGLMLGSQIQGQSGLRHISTATGQIRWGHEGFESLWVRALAVSPDGITLATGDEVGFLRLWDADTGTLLSEVRTGQTIQSLAFSPDGDYLAIGLWDGTIGISSVTQMLGL